MLWTDTPRVKMLFGACVLSAGLASLGGPSDAMLRVLAGRVRLVEGVEIRSFSSRSATHRLARLAYLESGAGSEFELAVSGRSSLRAWGPAAFEWQHEQKASHPTLVFTRCARIELEVRRGTTNLDLPEGWRLHVRAAALGVRELASGDLLVFHHGGATVSVESFSERGGAWPREIHSGQRVRLPAAPRSSR